MSVGTCDRCGETFDLGVDGPPFTSLSVSHHDENRDDFAESFCQSCGDELLADIYDEIQE